uniref:Rho-GAP domain-containing protein n=1 Tax=Macrostomum lignano TaxID=282301 RepID=A0A1I8FAW8_9PLAT
AAAARRRLLLVLLIPLLLETSSRPDLKQSGRHQLRHQPSKRDGAAPPLSAPLPARCRGRSCPCLSACVAYIEANGGLATEGVYRTCGNAYDIADTVSLLLSQPAELANRGPSLCTVTSALKQIIGKLTPPCCLNGCCRNWLSCASCRFSLASCSG